MDVSSPDRNGINKTNDYLKNDKSYAAEELDVDFVISKHVSDNYIYDEFAANDTFQLDVSEQQEEEHPSFSSDFGYCDIFGSTSGNFHSSEAVCDGEVLDETEFIHNQEKLQSESKENYELDEAENYLFGSVFKVEDSDAIHHEMENDSSTSTQQNSQKQDSTLNESMQKIDQLQHEGSQSEFADREIEEAVLVLQRKSLHLSPGSLVGDEAKREEPFDLRNSPDNNSKKIEFFHLDPQKLESTLQLPMSPGSREVSTCASQSPESDTSQQEFRDRSFLGRSRKRRHSSSKCSEPSKQVLLEVHSSMQMSSLKSLHCGDSSGEYDTNQIKIVRSKSLSPPRPKNLFLTPKKSRVRSCSRSPHKNFNDKILIDADPSAQNSPPSKRICSSQNSEIFLREQSPFSRSFRQNHDSTGRTRSGKEVASEDPVLCVTKRKPDSSPELWRRSTNSPLRHARTPLKYHHSRSNHQIKERLRSASPARKREFSSGRGRDYRNLSQSRYLRTRDNHRRYSPRRRSPPPAPPKYYSSHRSPNKEHQSSPHRRGTREGKPGRCLFVAGICFKTTERDLERKFSKYGHVRDVRIIRDKRSGDSRGFGFLRLERDEEADAAIRGMDKTEWNGRVILVEKSKTS